MRNTRFPTAPALLIALTLAVASCGGQPFPEAKSGPPKGSVTRSARAGASATPRARLLAAAQYATAAKTSRIALQMSLSGRGQTALTFTGSGAVDLAHGQMTMAVRQVADGDASEVEMRVVGRTEYVRADGVWTSIALGWTGVAALVPDPTSYIDFLQGVTGDVHVVGHETLRGDTTTRYAATLDLVRALTRTSKTPAQQAVIRAAIALLGHLQIPVSVWIDGLGRLRKLALSIDLTSAAKQLRIAPGARPKIQATVELYDFGVPVAVQVPAGAQSVLARAQNRAAQSDLRNALTAEKVQYTDQQTYTAAATDLKQIEPALDWGGKLTVVVGDTSRGPQQVVCLSERAASGTTFALADVASGPGAGTYYAKHPCPAAVSESSFSDFGSSW